ncbi:protein kinase superfamily protein [Actinidia rufa]|uniref:Protein kinase superfamily protein n=1 Tax=Actinidia rufa TaxID=165716 RepID=A0A7J0EHI4_9ERIC|nr:protein kinase superfamily protein [Actinidia rufa]
MDQSLQAILAASASFFVVIVLFSMICSLCRAQNSREPNHRVRTRTRPVRRSELSSIAVSDSAAFDPALSEVSMPELIRATRNFSPDLIIGDGSFGLVYKARLANDVTVAVKKLSPDAFQGFREFRAEMETLSKLRHPNIIQILGYCSTGSERVLIYEFVEKGSLDQWLLDTSSSELLSWSAPRMPLSWETRIKITIGVANGLAYMHNLETPIIHRDIKASNVLLDKEFEPHIADFGLARRLEGSHSHVSTQVAGTMGYMPPEYIHGCFVATAMGDVYSFGILMLEIATGVRPNLPFKGDEDGKEVRLVEWARKMEAQNRQMEMLDANVSREGIKEAGVVEFFRIAMLCTREARNDRPVMTKVGELLSQIST